MIDPLEVEDTDVLNVMNSTEAADGSLVIELTADDEWDDQGELLTAEAADMGVNLANFLDGDVLSKISRRIEERYTADKSSTEEFYETISKGIARLGLTIEPLSEPFPGATPITHPLIMEAAVKTQAKIMGEVFSGKGLVDTFTQSDKSPEMQDRCTRVKNYMDFQYLHQMKEFIPETDRLTYRYALTGNAFRKYYYDPILARVRTRYLTEDKFIASWDGTLIDDLDFHTEILPLMDRHELENLIEQGMFREDIDLEMLQGVQKDTSQVDTEIGDVTGESFAVIGASATVLEKFQFLETHCYLKLPEPYNDGEARMLPYVVIWDEYSSQILSIRRNWKKNDPRKAKRSWYVHYKLVPGLGFYAYGFIHLLQNFQFSLTLMLRSLLDAGQFANMKGGFVQKGALRIKGKSQQVIGMGQWLEADTGTKSIKDAFLPMDYGEPSQVLERMFAMLDGRAQQFADSTESVISDSTNYGPVGTTIALLEAATKFMSGIQKRFYQSLTEEFQILYDLNSEVLDDETQVYFKSSSVLVSPEDFQGDVGVIPQADPNLASSSHRIALAQTKLQAALQAPDIHDLRAAHYAFYSAIGMDANEINQILPPQEELQPGDPLTDIQNLGQGKPIKAFEGQDHDAHILFKTAFMEDVQGGANPNMASILPLVAANITEHQLLKYVASVKGVAQVNGLDPASEFDQARAAVQAVELNQLAAQVQVTGSPEDRIAEATLLDAETRAKMADHKVERDTADLSLKNMDQQIELLKIAQKGEINTSDQIANQVAILTQSDAGLQRALLENSLKELHIPNKTK